MSVKHIHDVQQMLSIRVCTFQLHFSAPLSISNLMHTQFQSVQFTCKELLYFLSNVSFSFSLLLLVSFIPFHILPPHSLFPHHTGPISFLPRQRPPSAFSAESLSPPSVSSVSLTCFFCILLSLILLLTSISPHVFLQYVFHKEFC